MKTALFKGPVMFLASSFLFAVMSFFVKLASEFTSIHEIAFVRFTMGIAVALLLAKAGKVNLSSNRRPLMIIRGVVGGLAILFFYAAIKTGTLTNATVLNNTYPIFATVIAVFYLREQVRPAILILLAVSITGIVLLTQPSVSAVRMGDFFAVISALLAGVSVVVIRELRKTETAWSVFFYLSIFGAAFSGVLALPHLTVPEIRGAGFILMAAVTGTLGQVLNTGAYKYCTASVGSTLSMSTAVFSAFFGMVFLGDRLTSVETLGAVMILMSSAYITYHGVGEKQDEIEGKQSSVLNK